jgi:hypothetical protein
MLKNNGGKREQAYPPVALGASNDGAVLHIMVMKLDCGFE